MSINEKSCTFSDPSLLWAHFICWFLQKANAWEALGRFIRSVSKFLAAIEKREIRAEFEEYLIQDYKRFSERESFYAPDVDRSVLWNQGKTRVRFSPACVVRVKAQQTSDVNTDGEKFRPKIRSIFNKTVIVDFLVNDLSFYMECERSGVSSSTGSVWRSHVGWRELTGVFWVCRFRHLADAGDEMASEGLYSETDYAMLHHKAELIINIFLHSDLSPKLLVRYYITSVSISELLDGAY